MTTSHMRPKKRHDRKGITLLETLIATVILLVAIAALGTQTAVGVRAARRVQLESMSAILCQSVIDELVATRQVNNTQGTLSINGHPGWLYTSEVLELPVDLQNGRSEGLLQMTVTTWKSGRSSNESRTSLTQFVRKPHVASWQKRSSATNVVVSQLDPAK